MMAAEIVPPPRLAALECGDRVDMLVKLLAFPLAAGRYYGPKPGLCVIMRSGASTWLAKYGTFDWYPEFDKPLGPPNGEAKRSGWTHTREFEHASVFVNLEKKTATIDWK